MKVFRFFLLVLIFSVNSLVLAQSGDWIIRSYEGSSTQEGETLAKREIQEQGIVSISENLIRELIGDEKFVKNKIYIQNKIIRQSAKYIPFIKQGDVTGTAKDFKLKVEFTVSLNNLKDLLLENNLLNENSVDTILLPLLVFQDSGKTYSWWDDDENDRPQFILNQDKQFERLLRKAFFKKGFYVLKPNENSLYHFLTQNLKSQTGLFLDKDRQELSKIFAAPILIQGQVRFDSLSNSQYSIHIQMDVLRADNGRTIAQVIRNYETERGNKETVVERKLKHVLEPLLVELSTQVQEAWQKGTATASKLSLIIKGHFQPQFNEQFKEKMRNQLTQVKNIYERNMGADFISFEIESSISAQELAQKIKNIDLNGVKLSITNVDSSDRISATLN